MCGQNDHELNYYLIGRHSALTLYDVRMRSVVYLRHAYQTNTNYTHTRTALNVSTFLSRPTKKEKQQQIRCYSIYAVYAVHIIPIHLYRQHVHYFYFNFYYNYRL